MKITYVEEIVEMTEDDWQKIFDYFENRRLRGAIIVHTDDSMSWKICSLTWPEVILGKAIVALASKHRWPASGLAMRALLAVYHLVGKFMDSRGEFLTVVDDVVNLDEEE